MKKSEQKQKTDLIQVNVSIDRKLYKAMTAICKVDPGGITYQSFIGNAIAYALQHKILPEK